MRRKVAVWGAGLWALGLAVGSVLAQGDAPAPVATALDVAGLDALARREMARQGLVNLSLAVMQDGKLVDVRAYGRARRGGPLVRP